MLVNLIRPFAGLRPAADREAEVAAPPYDVLSTEEAREHARGKRWSFLHISKPEINFAPETDPYAPAVYDKAGENLRDMIAQGILIRDDQPSLYVYRLAAGGIVQTGIVAAASVADYDSNRIRKHEFTRPDKEDDRVRQIDALNAQTGPVLLAYPDAPDVDAILAGVAKSDQAEGSPQRRSPAPSEQATHRCDRQAREQEAKRPFAGGVRDPLHWIGA